MRAQQIAVTLLFFPLIPPSSKRLQLMLNQTYPRQNFRSRNAWHREREPAGGGCVASLLSLKNKARNSDAVGPEAGAGKQELGASDKAQNRNAMIFGPNWINVIHCA
jgi:hypothetical protein